MKILGKVLRILGFPARLAWKPIKLGLELPGFWKLLTAPLAVVTLTVMIGSYYLLPEGASRYFLSDEPSVVHFEGSGKDGRAIMYVGGAGSSPLAQSVGLIPTLQRESYDTFVLENARDLFNADKVVDLAIYTLRGYREITFVAASMGGLIVYDTIKKLRAQGDTRHFGVVLIDAPGRGSDVAGIPELAKDFSWLPLGWTTNLWFPSQFDRNAPAVTDPDANRQQLEALWRSYETWKGSSWADQGWYTFSHGALMKLSGVTWYFIRSGADTFVNGDGAYAYWEASQGQMPRVVVPGGAHIALLNRPGPYSSAVANGIHHVAAA